MPENIIELESDLPANEEAEKQLLAAMTDEKNLPDILGQIRPEHLCFDRLRAVYDSIVRLFNSSQKITKLDVERDMLKFGTLEFAGGAECLSYIFGTDVDDVAQIIALVLEAYQLRETATIGKKMFVDSLKLQTPTDIIKHTFDSLMHINQKSSEKAFSLVGQVARKTITTFTQAMETTKVPWIYTGFKKLDEILGGIEKGSMVVLAANSSMGKTTFMLNIARNMANVGSVLVFSLEVPKDAVSLKLLGMESRISPQRIKFMNITKQEVGKVNDALKTLDDLCIAINDTPRVSPTDIRVIILKALLEHDIKCIFIDYLQLMSLRKKGIDKFTEISEITREIEAIGKEFGIPIIVLSQLNRANVGRGATKEGSSEPKQSDLRGSGEIEQCAHTIIFIHDENYHESIDKREATTNVKILVAKNRSGATGYVEMQFDRETGIFREV